MKQNDCLSQMPSNVVEHFGQYLTQKESIEFGYINKQLCFETHTKSFTLNRRTMNDETFELDHTIFDIITHRKQTAYCIIIPSN